MKRVTVCWEDEARDDLAALWSVASDRHKLSRAVNEIDQLLRINPSTKGTPFGLAMLDEAGVNTVLQRTQILPEDLRRLVCGPIVVYFTAHELDGQAKVWHGSLSGR